MQCLQCQHENREGRRFCAECGTALSQPCPTCKFINEPGERFCGGCGIPLIGVTSSPIPSQTAQPSDIQALQPTPVESPLIESSHPLDAERRQLTVMFCDLVGSTQLSAQLDPEDLRDVIQSYQQTAAKIIAHYEGYVAQYLGDGLLVYFGYPQAHEEDAQRAVRAGLDLLDAMGPLNIQLEQDKSVQLAVRMGIHTGLVVVGSIGGGEHQERLALGETPNISARLEGIARPNQIVVSVSTRRLLGQAFDLEDLSQQVLKGIADPLQVYGIVGERTGESRFEISTLTALSPLVGREEETSLFLRRWEQAKSGEGQIVLLSGEPGIGKSRSVQTVIEQLSDGPHLLMRYQCSPYHTNTAFYPITEQFAITAGFTRDDTADDKLDKLETHLEQVGLVVTEAAPLFAAALSIPTGERYAPLNVSPQQQKERTISALVHRLLAAASQQPLLFIVEDLHWSDPTSLETIGRIIEVIQGARILMLCTHRPEFVSPWGANSLITTLSLNRLSRSQSADLATGLTGGKRLPPEVVEQILVKSDGIPLFIEEVTKGLLESGWLAERGDAYELVGALPPMAIPSTLQDALMARLDRLSGVKEVAQVGAAIGREFSYELLRAIAPIDESLLPAGLQQLVDADLCHQRGTLPQATYTFKHALVRDAAYTSLLKSTRQRVHQQIAQALETHFSETAKTQPEVLAHHYTEAGLGEKGVTYWQRAGDHAIQQSAYSEAIAHLDHGLLVLMALPETRERDDREIELHLALGDPLIAAKGNAAPEVGRSYARIRELCERREDASLLIRALQGLRIFHTARTEHRRAAELGEEVLRIATVVDDPVLLAKAHHEVGVPLFYLGQLSSALDHFKQSVAYADNYADNSASQSLDLTRSAVVCRCYISLVLWALGYSDQSQQWLDDALMHSQRVTSLRLQATANMWAVHLYAFRREWPLLQEKARHLIAFCSQNGLPQAGAVGTIMLGWWRVLQDHDRDGLTQLCQGIQAFLGTGGDLYRVHWLSQLAEAYVHVGQPKDGLAAIEEAFDVMHATEEYFHHAKLYELKGRVLLACSADHHEEAETCFQQAQEISRSQEIREWELRAATSLARLWQSQGKRQEAYDLLASVYEWFTEGFDTADLMDARSLLDELNAEKMPPIA